MNKDNVSYKTLIFGIF